ncbi:YciI family protein [Propionicimonas sp.]|uniref:YciI family protein n=1 Tax=Propionicimonas sp. TaxID=1955623 RepID=UPI0039E576F4
MTSYLISFPSRAMVLTEAEFPVVAEAARTVIEEAKAAGVYLFAGGIEESAAPVLVSPDGSVTAGTHPGSEITGGFTVLDLPSREEALEWARRIAVACRCPQEVREFG